MAQQQQQQQQPGGSGGGNRPVTSIRRTGSNSSSRSSVTSAVSPRPTGATSGHELHLPRLHIQPPSSEYLDDMNIINSGSNNNNNNSNIHNTNSGAINDGGSEGFAIDAGFETVSTAALESDVPMTGRKTRTTNPTVTALIDNDSDNDSDLGLVLQRRRMSRRALSTAGVSEQLLQQQQRRRSTATASSLSGASKRSNAAQQSVVDDDDDEEGGVTSATAVDTTVFTASPLTHSGNADAGSDSDNAAQSAAHARTGSRISRASYFNASPLVELSTPLMEHTPNPAQFSTGANAAIGGSGGSGASIKLHNQHHQSQSSSYLHQRHSTARSLSGSNSNSNNNNNNNEKYTSYDILSPRTDAAPISPIGGGGRLGSIHSISSRPRRLTNASSHIMNAVGRTGSGISRKSGSGIFNQFADRISIFIQNAVTNDPESGVDGADADSLDEEMNIFGGEFQPPNRSKRFMYFSAKHGYMYGSSLHELSTLSGDSLTDLLAPPQTLDSRREDREDSVVDKHDKETGSSRGPVFWLDVSNPRHDEMDLFQNVFKLHTLTVEDICSNETNEKMERPAPHYSFMVFNSYVSDHYNPDFLDLTPVFFVILHSPDSVQAATSSNGSVLKSSSYGLLTFHSRALPHTANVLQRLYAESTSFGSQRHHHHSQQHQQHQHKYGGYEMSSPFTPVATRTYTRRFNTNSATMTDSDGMNLPPRDSLYHHATADWLTYAMIDDIADFINPVVRFIETETESIEQFVLILDHREQEDLMRRLANTRQYAASLLRMLQSKPKVVRSFMKRCERQMERMMRESRHHQQVLKQQQQQQQQQQHQIVRGGGTVGAAGRHPPIRNFDSYLQADTDSVGGAGLFNSRRGSIRDGRLPDIRGSASLAAAAAASNMAYTRPASPFENIDFLDDDLSIPDAVQPWDIRLHLADIQDHLETMHQSALHSEAVIARSHSTYLLHINLSMAALANKTNDNLTFITVIASMIVPLNLVVGIWGMNCHVPGQGEETLTWFFSILGGMAVFFLCALGWTRYRGMW